MCVSVCKCKNICYRLHEEARAQLWGLSSCFYLVDAESPSLFLLLHFILWARWPTSFSMERRMCVKYLWASIKKMCEMNLDF